MDSTKNNDYSKIREYAPYPTVNDFWIATSQGKEYLIYKKDGKQYAWAVKKDGYIPKSGLLFHDVIGKFCDQKTVLDLGCGEMGIISLLSLVNGAKRADAVDVDPECIKWLSFIKYESGIQALKAYESNMSDKVKDMFDLIVSNPPIMPTPDGKGNSHDTGGPDGRRFLVDIIHRSRSILTENGTLLMLMFEFLGTMNRTNDSKSLKEIAEEAGFRDVFLVKEVDKEIKPLSVTEANLDYIKSVYPKYEFKKKNGAILNTVQILAFSKSRE